MGFTQPRLLEHANRFPQANNAGVSTEGQIHNGAAAVAEASDQQEPGAAEDLGITIGDRFDRR